MAVFVKLYQQNLALQKSINELRCANEKIKQLSIRDSLTGCFNRGYLNENLINEIKRALRYKTTLALILTDIDHFKTINDTYGHQCGDKVLKMFTETMQSRIRAKVDWLSRYGGEEFVLVLPETSLDGAVIVAEKMRKVIESTAIVYGQQSIRVSASFGVATIALNLSNPDEIAKNLLQKADQRMYVAKNTGRNKVVGND